MPNGSFWQKVAYGVMMLLIGTLVYEIRQTRIQLVSEISGMNYEMGQMRIKVATWSVSILDMQRRMTSAEDEINRGVLPLAEQQIERLNAIHAVNHPHYGGGK